MICLINKAFAIPFACKLYEVHVPFAWWCIFLVVSLCNSHYLVLFIICTCIVVSWHNHCSNMNASLFSHHLIFVCMFILVLLIFLFCKHSIARSLGAPKRGLLKFPRMKTCRHNLFDFTKRGRSKYKLTKILVYKLTFELTSLSFVIIKKGEIVDINNVCECY